MTINCNETCTTEISLKTNNLMTVFDDISSSKTNGTEKLLGRLRKYAPSIVTIKLYIGVLLCGLAIYGSLWFIFKDDVLPGRHVFNMAGIVITGYVAGHTLERYTTINAVVGMTLTGALYRFFGPRNIMEHPVPNSIDYHLRRIYPVIILTKGPLGWNWDYIKNNPVKVFSLATLPWVVECCSIALFTHFLLKYPWYWGIHLGAILSSVSPAVVVPTVTALSARGLGAEHLIAELVANAGGLDTAFTEGMFGIINSAIFSPVSTYYKVFKALLAIFVGIGLGIFWGVLNDFVPDHNDVYASAALLAIFVGIGLGIFWGVLNDFVPDHNDVYALAVRSLLIFSGGLLLTYAGGFLAWGGTSGVAIMVCAGAAATRWARRGWPINKNPVFEVYKLLWTIFEPMLFTLSGYFLEISQITTREFCLMLTCILGALFFRLVAAFLVCLANEFPVKESLFIAVTWTPKAIVEAVLVRVAADSLWAEGTTALDKRIASQHANIIVIAILITSTLGSTLTTMLGPILLSHGSRVAPEGDHHRSLRVSPSKSSNVDIRNLNSNNNTTVRGN